VVHGGFGGAEVELPFGGGDRTDVERAPAVPPRADQACRKAIGCGAAAHGSRRFFTGDRAIAEQRAPLREGFSVREPGRTRVEFSARKGADLLAARANTAPARGWSRDARAASPGGAGERARGYG
jgi:hypothetical protein